MRWNKAEKQQLIIFAAVAFLLPYLLGILMGIAFQSGNSVAVFPNAQMYYPAAGAILALLITRASDSKIPRKFYIFFVVLAAVMALCCIASILLPSLPWDIIIQYVIIVGTLLCWVFYLIERKEKRIAYGLQLFKAGGSNPVWVIALFVILYAARLLMIGGISYLINPTSIQTSLTAVHPLYFFINLIALPINFFFVFSAFFGEEYGWRGFLQPLLQKQFGMRRGILVLGIVWGLWHLPINLFFYSPETSLQSIVNQIFVCICYSVFFGFAYLKTKSIWVPVILHYFNNNSIVLFASPDSIQNQVLTWGDVALAAIVMLVLYLPFLRSRVFSEEHALPLPRTQAPSQAKDDVVQ